MGKYDILNTPFTIGSVEIRNRFVMLPLTMGALSYDEKGGFSENYMKFLELRAEGGFGLIIPGAATTDCHVDPDSPLKPNVNSNPHWREKAGVRAGETDLLQRGSPQKLRPSLGKQDPGPAGQQAMEKRGCKAVL